MIDDMATDPAAPIERYGGGHRANIRLTSAQDAVQYLAANDGEIPFGFGDYLDEVPKLRHPPANAPEFPITIEPDVADTVSETTGKRH